MQLDDVRTALAERADQVPAGARAPREVLMHAQRTVRRRRVGRVVAGFAAALAIVLAVVAIAANGRSPERVVVSATSSTIVPVTGSSAEQLAAHAGAGVPAGWSPVDFRNARLFVPSNWNLQTSGTCFGGALPGLVSAGTMPMAGCQPADQYPVPDNAVAILPASTSPLNGGKPTIVHGYLVYAAEEFNPLWAVHVVPELGIKIEARGDLQDKILATLAPSAKKVALEFADTSAPAGQAYDADGLRMTIPAAWTVQTPLALCYWPVSFNGGPALLRLRPHMMMPSCPMMLATAATAAREGALLYTPGAPAPDPGHTPVAVLHHGDSTIRVFAGSSYTNTLDLFVQRAGSPTVHVLTLGLGRDGRVAGGVLSSIEATS